ncbi:DUF4879 domain-containing protein [Marinospirillum insulare]|uniref:DUF4879 domain-containing protein n=1 Tax=Marinospirillum insulare TaxID=217169 RepID=A0ABQ5ZV04_9GAMM|nr:DUF4879 domain-containing protein [Marinospirillum insulare]GLR63984.1 hypothetical protein GCM10007878_14220 [Marinospirillum insulare]
MKNIVLSVSFLAAFFVFGVQAETAGLAGKEVVLVKEYTKELGKISLNINEDSPLNTYILNSIEGIQPYAPAPSITSVSIHAVGSTNCGWEDIGLNQYTTYCDHGGVELKAVALVVGYGGNRLAWMNGNLLNSSKNYDNDPVCINNGQPNIGCTQGGVAVAYLRYYNLDGYENGKFEFQDTSMNAPWNTMSTYIFIQ